METSEKEIETSPALQSLLRVNHAGEWAAVKIYQGQLRVLKDSGPANTLHHILAQEFKHYEKFDAALRERRIQPTLLQPIWERAAYGLGVVSALLGTKAAMACTVAVEEVIEKHYAQQLNHLPSDTSPDVRNLVSDCYAEEIEHKDIGALHHAHEMKGYKAFTGTIKAGCRLAIWLSKRL